MTVAMKQLRRPVIIAAAVAITLTGMATTASADPTGPQSSSRRVQLEQLDRGLVAAATGEGVFLSWRLLGHEVTGASDRPDRAGLPRLPRRAADRHGHRQHQLPRPGRHRRRRATGSPPSSAAARSTAARRSRRGPTRYYDLPLRKPADGVTPAGEAYTYSANDMSVGDVDGDGQYEYVVKWDPSNSKDVSQVGYTGTGLHRHLRARRHPAAPHRPRRQHPRRRALHPVPGLRLRRRRPRRR